MIEPLVNFFKDNMPSAGVILRGGPPGLLWAYACLYLAGWLKRRKGLKTGYTRKVFHFLIFTSVSVVQAVWGTSAVCLFGGMTTLVVFYAIFLGDGHLLYEAMAREKDAPHRTYFIVAPYFATLIGGIASNLFFGPLALTGYLVAGFGDAIAEPVGTRFGAHPYTVPSFRGVRSTRTLEGSLSVFAASILALSATALLLPEWGFSRASFWTIPVFALVSALVEAVSPHGWDNATMQIVPSGMVALLV